MQIAVSNEKATLNQVQRLNVALCLPTGSDALAVDKGVVAVAASGDTLAADAGDTTEGDTGGAGTAEC